MKAKTKSGQIVEVEEVPAQVSPGGTYTPQHHRVVSDGSLGTCLQAMLPLDVRVAGYLGYVDAIPLE